MKPIESSIQIKKNCDSNRPYGKSQEFVPDQLNGNMDPALGVFEDRREAMDRRREKSLFAFLYGNFHPRRRRSRRSIDDHRYIFDWHEPHLLYVALAIVLLSCTDALFTLNLLNIGAYEANPLMNGMLQISVDRFLRVKIGLTAVSVVVLVFAAQSQFLGRFRVVNLLYMACFIYAALILYELFLFRQILA